MAFFRRILKGKEKPETKTVDLDDLDEWLKDKTEALDERTVPLGRRVRAEVSRLQPKAKRLSEELLQHHVPEDVLSSFRVPAENARRHFARGIATIIGGMELKEPAAYLDVVSLQSTINDALNSLHNLRLHQGRYVAEFFPGVYREILNQVNRLRLLAKQMDRTLADQGETFDLLQQISSKKHQMYEKLRLLTESKGRESAIEDDIEKTKTSATQLQDRVNRLSKDNDYLAAARQQEQMAECRENIRHLEQNIYRHLSLLSRTFRKYIKHTERPGHQIKTHSRKTLQGYLREPTKTFLNEANGYPALKALLLEMKRDIADGRLQLRQRSREKTLSNIDKILTGGLMPLKEKHQQLQKNIKEIEDTVSSSNVLKDLKAAKKDLSDAEQFIDKLAEGKERVSQTARSLHEDVARLRKDLEEQLSELDESKINLKIKGMGNTDR